MTHPAEPAEPQRPTIRITLKTIRGEERSVPLDILGPASSAFSILLNEAFDARIEEILAEAETPRSPSTPPVAASVEWVCTNVGWGSVVLDIDGRVTSDDPRIDATVAEGAAGDFATDLQTVEFGEEPEDVYSYQAADAVLQIAGLMTDDVEAMILDATGLAPIELTRGGFGRLQDRAPIRRVSIGSIEGTVVSVSVAKQPFFLVAQRDKKPGVRCYFDRKRYLRRVVAAFNRRVSVAGQVTRAGDDTPIALRQMFAFKVFDDAEPLPTVGDVLGIASDLTEGLSSEEWIGLGRGNAG